MPVKLPSWALRKATLEDRDRARKARRRQALHVVWPQSKALRRWAKAQGWRTPWPGLHEAFLEQMLASDDNFALALNDSGIALTLPIDRYVLPAEELAEFDALYEEKDEWDHFSGWGPLVAGLRELRRVVEAGVTVEIEGRKFKGTGSFYNWTHGRYHMLEDGYDSWILDDKS